MNDGFVAAVPELNSAPAGFVQEGLPDVFRGVGRTVHDSPVTQDDSRLILLQSDLNKDILERHLHLHDVDLEANGVGEGELASLDHCTALHQQSRRLGDQQDSEA